MENSQFRPFLDGRNVIVDLPNLFSFVFEAVQVLAVSILPAPLAIDGKDRHELVLSLNHDANAFELVI